MSSSGSLKPGYRDDSSLRHPEFFEDSSAQTATADATHVSTRATQGNSPSHKPPQLHRSFSSPLRKRAFGSKAFMSRGTPGGNTNPLSGQRLRRLGRLTDTIILKRYELQHEEQTLESCNEFLRQSSDEIIDAVNLLLNERDLESCHTKLIKLQSQLHDDREAFQNREARVKQLRSDLIKLESRWKKTTDKLSQFPDVAKITGPNDPINDSDAIDSDSDGETRSKASSAHSVTPPLLAKYFDRKGDIGVFRERLQELEYHYHEGLAERDFFADRGDPLEISDEQYYKDFVDQRHGILDELDKAQRDVESLARQCESAGLEIIENPNAPSSEASSSAEQSPLAHLGISASQPPPPSTPGFRGKSLLSTRSSKRVRGWLEGVPSPSSDPGISRPVETRNVLQAPVIRDQVMPSVDISSPKTFTEDPITPANPIGVNRSGVAQPPKLDNGSALSRQRSDKSSGSLTGRGLDAKRDVVAKRRSSRQSNTPIGQDQEVALTVQIPESKASGWSRFRSLRSLLPYWPGT